MDWDVVPFWLEMFSTDYQDQNNDDIDDDSGTFKLSFPSTVKVWRPDPESTDEEWRWIEVTNGESFTLNSWEEMYTGSAWAMAESPGFLLEGLNASTNMHDIVVTASFTKGLPGMVSDKGRFTAINADLGFNNNNSNAENSDPNDTLRDGTPDVGFVIDDADERTEENEGAIEWWHSGGMGIPSSLFSRDLEDLLPFSVKLPSVLDGLPGDFSLRFEPDEGAFGALWVFENPSPTNNRTKFLSDAPTAEALVLSSQQLSEPNYITMSGDHDLPLSQFSSINAGSNEYVFKVCGSGTFNFKLSLVWKLSEADSGVIVDWANFTIKDIKDFYSVASARGTPESPITSPTMSFEYPTERGRLEAMVSYPYQVIRDNHDSDVKQTAVYVHGFNVDFDDSEVVFGETFKRMYWQGFRGNLIGFSWHGDEGVPWAFDTNVENAFQTSPTLYAFLKQHLYEEEASGGWGLQPDDVNLAAHSLGNLVMWDAIRINGELWPNTKLCNNVISIQAAVWSEAFDYATPVIYPDGTTYSVQDLEKHSWHHWFNPAMHNIKDSISGKVFNSYFNEDELLLVAMRGNDRLYRGEHHLNRSGFDYRTGSNLVDRGALMLLDSRDEIIIKAEHLSLPIGSVPMPIADINVNARDFGWNNPDGQTFPIGDEWGHSNHIYHDYVEIYAWWRHVFAGDGNQDDAFVPIGKDC